jgi:uncharacterized protein with gpF-like domain
MSRGGITAQGYLIQRGQPILSAHYQRVYRDAFNSITEKVTKAAPLRVGQFMRNQLAWLESEAGTRISGISRNLVDDVSDIVWRGVREGKAQHVIADELEERIPDLSSARAATIARTETHSSATDAFDTTIREKGIAIVSKTWWTAGDNRVRESHALLHGETVEMDETFDVGDSEMMYPGDDSQGADAGEIVNCRCSCLYNSE